MEEKKLILLSVTDRGIPCLWEKGGKDQNGYTSALLIADNKGYKKDGIYFKTLFCDEHALIPITIGDLVCDFFQDYEDGPVLWQIEDIDVQQQYASLVKINKAAALYLVKMTERKAMHYKCTIPYFVKNWDQKTQYKINKFKRERRG